MSVVSRNLSSKNSLSGFYHLTDENKNEILELVTGEDSKRILELAIPLLKKKDTYKSVKMAVRVTKVAIPFLESKEVRENKKILGIVIPLMLMNKKFNSYYIKKTVASAQIAISLLRKGSRENSKILKVIGSFKVNAKDKEKIVRTVESLFKNRVVGSGVAKTLKVIGSFKEEKREGIIKAAEPLFKKGISGDNIAGILRAVGNLKE